MSRFGVFRVGNNRRLRVLLLALVALVATALMIVGYATDLLGSVEGSTVNTRFSIRGHQRPPKNIVVVKIDSQTFTDLNQQFPFPRAMDGRVINNIARQGAAAIAFDVQLSEPSQLGQGDDCA